MIHAFQELFLTSVHSSVYALYASGPCFNISGVFIRLKAFSLVLYVHFAILTPKLCFQYGLVDDFPDDRGSVADAEFSMAVVMLVSWLQTTQPTSGGAVTADSSCCANCVEPPRLQQWGPDLPLLGMPAMRTRWMAGAVAHKSG